MAQRGPKPTPTNILRLRGSWRGQTRPQEPTAVGESPPIPRWLTPEQRKMWKQVSGELLTLGVLARVDAGALTRYVCMRLQWQRLIIFIQTNGETYEVPYSYHTRERVDASGEVIPDHTVQTTRAELRPQTKLLLALSDRLLRLEQSFGMTPSARAALGVELARTMPKPTHPLTGNPRRFLNLDADR